MQKYDGDNIIHLSFVLGAPCWWQISVNDSRGSYLRKKLRGRHTNTVSFCQAQMHLNERFQNIKLGRRSSRFEKLGDCELVHTSICVPICVCALFDDFDPKTTEEWNTGSDVYTVHIGSLPVSKIWIDTSNLKEALFISICLKMSTHFVARTRFPFIAVEFLKWK